MSEPAIRNVCIHNKMGMFLKLTFIFLLTMPECTVVVTLLNYKMCIYISVFNFNLINLLI